MENQGSPPWPPTLWATEYERQPPPGFRPKLNRPAIPLTGVGVLIVPPAGTSMADLPEDAATGHDRSITITWAQESLRAGQRYYRLACLVNWMDWAIDEGEDWSPTERELRNQLAVWWVSGQQAVDAFFNFQKWRKKVTGEAVDDPLRRLRNSLVHLDEAWLDDYSAHSVVDAAGRSVKAKDIRNLPEGLLPLAFDPGCIDALYGVIPLHIVYRDASMHSTWPGEDHDWSDYEFDPSAEDHEP